MILHDSGQLQQQGSRRVEMEHSRSRPDRAHFNVRLFRDRVGGEEVVDLRIRLTTLYLFL